MKTLLWAAMWFAVIGIGVAAGFAIAEECREQWRTNKRMKRWRHDEKAFTVGGYRDTGNLRVLAGGAGDAEDGEARKDG